MHFRANRERHEIGAHAPFLLLLVGLTGRKYRLAIHENLKVERITVTIWKWRFENLYIEDFVMAPYSAALRWSGGPKSFKAGNFYQESLLIHQRKDLLRLASSVALLHLPPMSSEGSQVPSSQSKARSSKSRTQQSKLGFYRTPAVGPHATLATG